MNANSACAPVAGASVEIWQCDVAGEYSHTESRTQTFLRGIQTTNASGQVNFVTVYPGWYQGRATHIHVEVTANGRSAKVTQIAFPEERERGSVPLGGLRVARAQPDQQRRRHGVRGQPVAGAGNGVRQHDQRLQRDVPGRHRPLKGFRLPRFSRGIIGRVTPRVRFAPSPTGYLHVGGARTALFNWLYARRHGGVFVLRIEDTDVERSSADMVTGILDGLRWLGLDWDEGPLVGGPHAPYFQSQRLDRHRAAAGRLHRRRARLLLLLLRRAPARRARSARRRAARRGSTTAPAWPARPTTRAALDAEGTPRALRFKVRPGTTSFDDAVHGTITFDSANIEDFVILRSDGHPTYHLSVVVDDVDMAITHVIRGDDHISNTPKHVLLFEAMGAPVPRFAHVPLILGRRQETPEQTAWRDVGDGVRATGLFFGRHGQFPGPSGLVARRRPRAAVEDRAD